MKRLLACLLIISTISCNDTIIIEGSGNNDSSMVESSTGKTSDNPTGGAESTSKNSSSESTENMEIIDAPESSISTGNNDSESSESIGTNIQCGNSVIEENEECDDGNLIDEDICSNECILPRIVFLSSEYIGLPDFGGIDIADDFCQNEAQKFNISGTFKAWLSDDNPDNDPIFRLNSTNFKGWYILPSIDDDLELPVAKGWNGLIEDLVNPINVTSAGVKDFSNVSVWTNTNNNGYRNDNTTTCTNWTQLDEAKMTQVGSPKEVDGKWTAYSTVTCSGPFPAPHPPSGGAKIYCFQVDD